MAWEIVFPGNPSVMADSLRSVVMLMGYGGENYYLNIVKTGLLFSLLVTLFNGISLKKGFRLDNLLLHFVVVMAALIPTTTVTVTNYDARVGDSFVAPQVVDNVPLVMAVPISAATMLGSSLQERLDQVMTPMWVAQNRELFCKKSSGEVSWRTCNFLEAYMESVGRILTSLGGTEVQVNPVWEQNRAAFNRTCDPLNKGPQPNNVMATNVVESWGEFCSSAYITSKQEVIPFIPFNSTVEVGRWGEIKLSNNQPIPQVSCESACNSIKAEIENNPFILSGCKNEDECRGMKNNFERILRFNELSNRISEQVFMTNLMYICASHDRVGRGPLQSTFEVSGSNCKEFASRFLGKLNMAERARETATSRTAFLMTMAAVTFPFIIILVAFGNNMAGKAVIGYAAFMVFLSLVPSIYSASDAIFARQVEQRAELLGVSPVFGGSTSTTMCKSAASSSTCANEVVAFLNDTVNMAENIAEFQSGGIFALAGLIAMMGSLGALVGGGGGGGGIMAAGSSGGPLGASSSGASGMSGGGSVAGQPMAADIYRGLQMANAATRGGGGFSDPGDFLQSATNFIQGFAAYRSSMPSSVAAQSSMGRAEASFGKEASSSAKTGSTASMGSSLNLEAGEMAQIQDAISDIAQRVQNGLITNMSELQNAFAAASKKMNGRQREAFDQVAAKFEADLGGQLGVGAGGDRAREGDKRGPSLPTPKAGLGVNARGAASQQKSDSVKDNTGVSAEKSNSTTATTKGSTQFSKQDLEAIQASLQKMRNEFFKSSAGEQGGTQQSGGKDASSSSSESFRGMGSMASPQEMMGGMYALMDEKGKMLSANELKEALQQKMMAAGMSQEQANKFGQAFAQEMGRLKSYGQGVGSTMQAMTAATSAASMLAAKRDPDDAQTGLLASMVMAGQSGAAAQLAASLRDQEQKAKQTEGLAGEWLKWGEGLSAQARDRLMQGAKMAEEVGGEVLARNAQLRNEVASALRDAAKNSTVMDRAAVDKAYQQAVNKVLGTSYTMPEAKEVLKLAKQMFTDGLKGVGKFVGDELGNLATPGAILGAAYAGGAAAKVAGPVVSKVLDALAQQGANLAVSGYALNSAVRTMVGAALSNGARSASIAVGRFAAALGPVGVAYAVADGAVALATGKGITDRIIDYAAGSPQSGQPANPSSQSQAQPASAQPDATPGGAPRGIGISGGGFSADFNPTHEEVARGNQIAQMVYNDLKGPQKGVAPASNGDFVNQTLKTLGEAPTQSPNGAGGVAPGVENAPGRVSLTQGQPPAANESPRSPSVQVSVGPSQQQQTNPVTLNQAPTREQPSPANKEVDKPVEKGIQASALNDQAAQVQPPSSPASPLAPAGSAPFAVAGLGDGLAGAGSLPVLGSGLPQGQIAGNTMNTMIVAPERSVGGDAQGQAMVASANSSLLASGVPLSDSGSQASAIPVDTRGGSNVIV